jgi:RNA polymerase sigma-70 factor (ECF subfamily)
MRIQPSQESSRDVQLTGVVAEVYDARLERLRQRDNDTWAELITETESRLYNYVLYNVSTPEDAKDLMSDIYLAALRSISSLDSSSASLRWLYGIARHRIADYWRHRQPAGELPESLEAPSNHISIEVRQALATLPVQTRQALLLRYREGLSVQEVAQILGRSYKATESLFTRGRALLAAALDAGGEV